MTSSSDEECFSIDVINNLPQEGRKKQFDPLGNRKVINSDAV